MLYNISGGESYKILIIAFLIIYFFTWSHLFKEIQPEVFFRNSTRAFIRFALRFYSLIYFYYLCNGFVNQNFLAFQLMLIYMFICQLQIKIKLMAPDEFRITTLYLLALYLFVTIFSVQALSSISFLFEPSVFVYGESGTDYLEY